MSRSGIEWRSFDGSSIASAAAMIRAFIQSEKIRPLDPLSEDWTEGRHLIVADTDSTPSDDMEEWYRELQKLGPARYEPCEWERVQATLSGADEMANAMVRRQMGLP